MSRIPSMPPMGTGRRIQIAHLETIKEDIRNEIKKRIEQRDKYSYQLTLSLGAILSIAFSKYGEVIIVAPLVSIYFTTLILYSYRIHSILAQYLRKEIEPLLADLCGTPPDIEWETYYEAQKLKPGIREAFFKATLWPVYVMSLIFLCTTDSVLKMRPMAIALGVAMLISLVAIIVITQHFRKVKG